MQTVKQSDRFKHIRRHGSINEVPPMKSLIDMLKERIEPFNAAPVVKKDKRCKCGKPRYVGPTGKKYMRCQKCQSIYQTERMRIYRTKP